MATSRSTKLDPPVDSSSDHLLGNPDAELTLVEYGSYACPSCHSAHEVIADLRDRFGERLRYVFRHRPVENSADAMRAAELAERVFERSGRSEERRVGEGRREQAEGGGGREWVRRAA